jgi:formylglycine-generating enzyme required for sulfatase activity
MIKTKGKIDRVGRGGAWDDGARRCRSAYRFIDRSDFQYDYVGFRLVRRI